MTPHWDRRNVKHVQSRSQKKCLALSQVPHLNRKCGGLGGVLCMSQSRCSHVLSRPAFVSVASESRPKSSSCHRTVHNKIWKGSCGKDPSKRERYRLRSAAKGMQVQLHLGTASHNIYMQYEDMHFVVSTHARMGAYVHHPDVMV